MYYRVFIALIFEMLLLVSCQHSGNNSLSPNENQYGTSEIGLADSIQKKFPAQAEKIYNGLIANTSSIKNPELHCRALYGLASLLYNKTKFELALEYYTTAYQVARKNNILLWQARCLERMAIISLESGNEHKSLQLLYESLTLYEKCNDKRGLAEVYNVLGGLKSYLKEFGAAESYLRKALKLNELSGNNSGVIENKANLAFMYHYMDRNDKAKQLYVEVLPQLIRNGDSVNLAAVYSNLSLFFQWINQPDSSMQYMRRALAISEKIKDRSSLSTYYGMIGMNLMESKQYDSASYFLNLSVKLAKEFNDYFTQRQALQLLLSLDTLHGDYRKAAWRYAEIVALNDSVYEQKIANNQETAELKYENQKKNSEIEIQKTNLTSSRKQKYFLLILFTFTLAVSILLGLLIVQIRRNTRRKQELLSEELRLNELHLENARKTDEINRLRIENTEKELKIKEKEQVSNALALEHKNELILMINSRISEMRDNVGTIEENALNSILSSIKMQPKQEDESNLFNQKFISLHPSFFETLRSMHPELTKSELRFCAYLKLNLDSTQVANIHNITSEAIRKIRYRVRKKLRLSPDSSLEDYISRV